MASNFLEQWKKTGRKINHSGFDVSGKRIWGTPAGLHNIPFHMETNPNELFDIDVQGYMRTETMNTAAYVDGKVITSLFFVPYSQIWHNYNTFVTQKDDRHSAAYKDCKFVPTFRLNKLYKIINNMYYTYLYMYYTDLRDGRYDVNKFPSYNLSYYKTLLDSHTPDVAFAMQFVVDMHGIPYIFNLLRAVQYFKFGNPYEIIALYDEELKTYIADPSQSDAKLKTALDAGYKAFRDKYTPNGLENANVALNGKSVNIFRPAAYQHIFYDYYRNKFFDEIPYYQPTLDPDYPNIRYIDIFNYDDLECSTLSTSEFLLPYNVECLGLVSSFDWARFLNLFDLHYRQWKHDIYTSAMLSTQFGVVSGVSFEGTPNITISPSGNYILSSASGSLKGNQKSIASVVTDVSGNTVSIPNFSDGLFDDESIFTSPIAGSTLNSDFEGHTGDELVDINQLGTVSKGGVGSYFTENSNISLKLGIPSLFNVLQLRRAELLQQWKQNALRAGNMVDDNFKAHYGVEPYYESTNNVNLIGSWECPLEAKPITATASTGDVVNGKVGDLAALGVGSAHGHKVRFKTNDFGVIMAVSYFLPDVVYSANGIDAQNTLVEPFDFYSEEFENIGFENLPFWRQSIGFGQYMDNNFGFVPPYTMYKTNVDECFDEFAQIGKFSGSMRAWTVQRADIPAAQIGDVAVRSRSAFYVDPRVTDALFAVTYDGSSKTNPIACYFNFDFKALRPMSVLGLPIFS